MELKQQVTNLELSKQLKELGVKQESLFVWANSGQHKNKKQYFELSLIHPISKQDITFMQDYKNEESYSLGNHGYKLNLANEIYSAFTASELVEMLPKIIKKENEFLKLVIGDKTKIFPIADEFLQNTMAKMLIYLIENKLTNAGDSK